MSTKYAIETRHKFLELSATVLAGIAANPQNYYSVPEAASLAMRSVSELIRQEHKQFTAKNDKRADEETIRGFEEVQQKEGYEPK